MAFETLGDNGYVVSGERDTRHFRLMVLKNGLKLECKGLKMSRGKSCYAVIKQEFGLKGSKAKVLEAFEKIVEERSQKVLGELAKERETTS